ncbi:AAA family ATPase [Actinomadura sp. 6K520]|uniref:AAA family ATPase n=1 Tax=Actinomadura sp. 6K520 TaxID=2530364 RepID=UPI00104ABE45|nr:AAA family ATPase [Actinomadura sp. 6K520]TDE32139.1 hypothetical protein E1289_16680 [Actinomadura sp. 6K520]
MITIGVEGVSCTGKTTLTRALAGRSAGCLAATDTPREVCIVPCYYHAAPDPKTLSNREVKTEADQLALLAAHLEVEQLRDRQARSARARGSVVVLDRTVDTLLAHVRAVGHLRGLDARAQARRLVTEAIDRGHVAVPAVTLLLQASHEVLSQRAQTRTGMPPLYYDPDFTQAFQGHFADPITAHCLVINATGGADQVVDQAWKLLKPYLDGAQ